jgi:putative hydrolase of the HAD superfamily
MQVDVRDRRAILIDALGTLIELEPPAARLREELRRRCAVEVSEADARLAIGAEIAFYREHLDEGRDETSLRRLREGCAGVVRESLRALHVDLDCVTEALLASLHFGLFDDARVALEACRERGQRVVVVSNWDISLHAVLERLGLGALLGGIVTSAEVGARKPAPAIFERALLAAGARARDAVHVGDSLEEDVRGALNAGIEPILIRREGGPGPDSVRTITTLAALA